MQKQDGDVIPGSACGSQEPLPESRRPNTLNSKRTGNDDDDMIAVKESGEKRRKVAESVMADELLLEQISILEACGSQDNLISVFDSLRGEWEPDFYVYDPHAWEVSVFEDMCEPVQYSQINYDEVYYDETTWEQLDPQHVAEAEAEEMKRFRDRQVYSYVARDEAMRDKEGKFVKTRWVRINKGSKLVPRVRCRLVAPELAHGKKDDELYAGTPSLSTMKLVLSWYCTNWQEDDVIKIIDVKCAFLYGDARRKIYIELPRQDPHSGDLR